MKQEGTAPSASSEEGERRRVRLFVALHLGAVGAIYAIAVIVGGGLQGPPMPPLTGAHAAAPAANPLPKQQALDPPVVARDAAAPPAWAQRAEITRPWETR